MIFFHNFNPRNLEEKNSYTKPWRGGGQSPPPSTFDTIHLIDMKLATYNKLHLYFQLSEITWCLIGFHGNNSLQQTRCWCKTRYQEAKLQTCSRPNMDKTCTEKTSWKRHFTIPSSIKQVFFSRLVISCSDFVCTSNSYWHRISMNYNSLTAAGFATRSIKLAHSVKSSVRCPD